MYQCIHKYLWYNIAKKSHLFTFNPKGHSHGGGGHGHSHGGGNSTKGEGHGHSHGVQAGGQAHGQTVECERKLAKSKPSNGAISSDGLSESEIDEVIDLEKIAPNIGLFRGLLNNDIGD